MTGAAGFVGSHLCEKLIEEGHEILAVDNFYTGAKENILPLLKENQRFELLRHDITFPLYVEVDFICNLASPASPRHYQWDPVQTLKTNVLGSINLLGLAKRLRVPIFQASTSEVYGDPQVHPQKEDYWGNVNPIGSRSCYDEGKRAAETLFHDYNRQHLIDTRVARIFNTYGPRMAIGDGRVVSNLIVQALSDEPLTIYGDGSQTRSFCYVDDLINGIVSMCNAKELPPGPINLGNPREVTILELANLVIKLAGSASEIRLEPLPADDPTRRRPDIGKAREILGWEPQISLESGLSRTIDYFQNQLSLP